MKFIAFIVASFFVLAHPLHVSVTEVAFDAKEDELEITLRVFTDDLELAIREAKKDNNLNLLKPVNTTIDKLVWEYLEPRVKISVEGKPQAVKYLGHEKEEDVFIFYVQVQPVKNFQTLSITNSIITELYHDQANLVNVTINDKTKSLRLMRNNPSGTLSFDQK